MHARTYTKTNSSNAYIDSGTHTHTHTQRYRENVKERARYKTVLNNRLTQNLEKWWCFEENNEYVSVFVVVAFETERTSCHSCDCVCV